VDTTLSELGLGIKPADNYVPREVGTVPVEYTLNVLKGHVRIAGRDRPHKIQDIKWAAHQLCKIIASFYSA